MDGYVPPAQGDDPELEREFELWAQLLLDVYLWKMQQERKASGIPEVDTGPSSPTI